MFWKLAKSGAWVALDNISAAALAFAFFIATARLLGPEQFGVTMLVLSIFQILQPLVESLFHDAVIQKQSITNDDITSTASFCLIFSVSLAVMLWLSAPLFASLLSVPALADYIPFLGLGLIFSGSAAVVSAVARRELKFRLLATRTIFARSIGLVVGVWMAATGFGVWSVVAQILATTFFAALLVLLQTSLPFGKIKFDIIKPFLAFAIPTTGTQFLVFASTRIIVLVIGAFLGPIAAGVWGVAFRFVEPIQAVLTTTVGQATLPLFSRSQTRRDQIANYFVIGTHGVAVIFVPLFLGLAFCSHDVILLFVGEGWLSATRIMQIICACTALTLCRQIADISLIAIGRPRLVFYTHAAAASISMLAVLAGVSMSLIAVALGWSFRVLPFLTINVFFLNREFGLRPLLQFSIVVLPLASSLVMCGALFLFEMALPIGVSSLSRLLILVPLGGVVYCAMLLSIDSRARRLISWRKAAPGVES